MAVTRRPGPGSRSGEPRRGQNPAYRPSDPVILAHRSSRPRPCPKISQVCVAGAAPDARRRRRTRLEFVDDATDNSYSSPETCPAIGIRATGRSEEHTSEPQYLMRISYALFCLKKKTETTYDTATTM